MKTHLNQTLDHFFNVHIKGKMQKSEKNSEKFFILLELFKHITK